MTSMPATRTTRPRAARAGGPEGGTRPHGGRLLPPADGATPPAPDRTQPAHDHGPLPLGVFGWD
ncbi:hypothetical protein [Actinoalloteichus caeruleus]|uniref:hypothetical protein n=1 Tax=Actinoalloteichus cyanogriseus TaxID=2893586 RepID=UPI000A880816|nr:hypothetical protein [Actinoalloteichus caeruleus]